MNPVPNPVLSVATEPRFVAGAGIRSRLLGLGLRATVRPTLALWASLPFDVFPTNLLDHAARLLPVQEGTRWRRVRLANCPAELVSAKGVSDDSPRVILYFHGGAFLACGLNTHRRMVSYLSRESAQPVFNVGYRQMPDTAVSGSVADGVDAFRWLLEQGYRAEDITVAGDSAGGFLAFSVARQVIDAGLGRPAGIVAVSPLLDLDPMRKLAHANANSCQTFPMRAIDRHSEIAHRIEQSRGTGIRVVSPVDMAMDGLPPALIQVGSQEVLLPDAELMANRLVAAGIPCELHVWDRQVHVFQAAASWVPEAKAAIAEIGTFVRGLPDRAVPPAPTARRKRSPRGFAASAIQQA
jgi:acetyl esterase/lipase